MVLGNVHINIKSTDGELTEVNKDQNFTIASFVLWFSVIPQGRYQNKKGN